ncbi:MAG: hypothetical protein K9G33_02050 [Sneathiella sp.]|nr:hypothetical protein [Sneathiella sp.]
MGLILGNLNKALSVKSCYSKFLFSSAVFLLTFLLSAAFFMQETPKDDFRVTLDQKTAFLD